MFSTTVEKTVENRAIDVERISRTLILLVSRAAKGVAGLVFRVSAHVDTPRNACALLSARRKSAPHQYYGRFLEPPGRRW
jgi:prolyl-tRNA editing enzyme YbaK/EbsC (Cys-tRNA(Pro) deacylase)